MSQMTPREIVEELDKHIVGQKAAKRAVAIALRNRWRRQQVAESLRHEITPKNILMIGPTGVGKTEIARRLARLAKAPFIKVEATKFTEVGYVGREVDSIVRGLVEISVKMTREEEMSKVRHRAADAAEDRVLDILLPRAQAGFTGDGGAKDNHTRQRFPKMLREGVQRDLLPLVEGCTVNTKYGTVKTDHVLFIASGAFHMSKPSDLIPELQGRLPIRVELEPLVVGDFVRILTEPDASLCRQYSALMATEGLTLEFVESGVQRLAEVVFEVNERTENIGARRLHTVMERLLETVSFDAADRIGTRVVINRVYVESNLGELVKDEDLSRYIL